MNDDGVAAMRNTSLVIFMIMLWFSSCAKNEDMYRHVSSAGILDEQSAVYFDYFKNHDLVKARREGYDTFDTVYVTLWERYFRKLKQTGRCVPTKCNEVHIDHSHAPRGRVRRALVIDRECVQELGVAYICRCEQSGQMPSMPNGRPICDPGLAG